MTSNQASTTTTTTLAPTAPPVLTLHLRPRVEEKSDPSVTWDSSVIDNEHLNKKSSKKCCIFHKARAFGESDSEESDSDWEGFDKDDSDQKP